MPRVRFARSATWLFVFGTLMGCTAEAHRYIKFPDLAHPGPAAVQRADAIRHDPYPLNDVGPEVVGGRPLAYQQPVNEVDRSRMPPPIAGVVQPIPIPGTAVPAPPVLSSPIAVQAPQPGMPLGTTPPPVVTTPVPAISPGGYTTPAVVTTSPVTAPLPANPFVPGTNSAPGVFPSQQRAPY
ncbi:MAG: hypothetical protein IT425_07405 [Pirellulales bacterium]|nr:hypothetical protein [Pirellulales bacterium]